MSPAIGVIKEIQTLPRPIGFERSLPRLDCFHTRWPKRILVSADESASAGDALAMANALGTRSSADVELLSVFAPRIPMPNAIGERGAARCESPDRRAAAELLRSVRSEERRRFGGRAKWPVRLEVGHPAHVILDRAKNSGAELIVLGIGHSDTGIRQRGNGTPATICNYTDIPVLAAAQMRTALAQVGILFVDRETPHRRAVRAALQCLEDAAFLWVLIHAGDHKVDGSSGVRLNKATISRVLEIVRTEAAAISKGIVVRAVCRTGDAVDELLSLAGEVSADIIVTSVHGAAGAVRSFIPNIADRLLLTAPCSVLVVPEEPVDSPS